MAFDQFPNAARLERLGVARVLPPKDFRAPAVTRTLVELLGSAEVARHCQALARRSQDGNALEEACLAVEELARTAGS
jgi:UDP:flavonoid glycosyltransferase YjiC (YdhE family)